MKRFAAFHGYEYYPSGGWADLLGLFDTEDEAKFMCEQKEPDRDMWRFMWAHIVDLERGVVCADLHTTSEKWVAE